MIFHNTLIYWYLQKKRDLPWRKTKDPYRIWLSEIMLQQTRVAQGLPYFLKFKKAFPTVFDLAKADESKVLKLWQGLGYYSRARNLHFTAKYIANELDGKFPTTYKELLKLKGVGDYTASAIASICFDEAAAVVDGNVYRVVARYFGIDTPINSTAGIKEFKELAQTLIDKDQPGLYNQAIMDFGALHCKPQNPLCNQCPFLESCVAFNKKLVDKLPVKEKKLKIKNRYFNYLVVVTKENKTILQERTEKGIWKGLYQFPLIETQESINEKVLIENDLFSSLFSEETIVSLFNKEDIVHKLSHQHLHTKFWIVKTQEVSYKTVDFKNIHTYPVPVLIDKFLTNFLNIKK
ncbi:A/G-specific adenine glycosylase [Tenacibaculum sp. IB213877]|uniref:A/G-specific adenine glycosylase n=1 Tax=Tenacibaculum sp. IB213877 TaxID=3097351 RepID=UPI002A5A4DDF|nr:A/G-specific adenine glycosylase [Tenacibaculum sp. IB213877]MDY0780367.1 A/G-specific adenine glycosylase [Tenacibaculum sp. IB213877]